MACGAIAREVGAIQQLILMALSDNEVVVQQACKTISAGAPPVCPSVSCASASCCSMTINKSPPVHPSVPCASASCYSHTTS